jgi:hypothetical protein
MHTKKPVILRLFRRAQILFGVFVLCAFFVNPACADILDAYNLAPFVPLVLETMMNIATSLYNFFVGNGTGIIYLFIYAFLGFYICLYLVKMHFPKDWLSFLGFSDGGEMWENKIDAWKISENVLKPCLRAIIAAVFLLQIKPVYVTEWLVNPFLEFGSFYTEQILVNINNSTIDTSNAQACPASIEESGWISKRSCDFLVKPVYIISQENNKVIKYGFDFLKKGFRGMLTLIPHGGEDLLNIITGILLLVAFVSANVFMALLIIQAIFDFCLSLIMYPFNVLAWVAKKSDKWFDILPAFSQIIDALKNLIVTMIACAFILCVNIAVVRALFNWSSSVFSVGAGGVSVSNVPSITNTAGNFGQHSILWISSLLTLFLMQNIFKMTRERLDMYTKGTPRDLYNKATGDTKILWEKIKSTPNTIKTVIGIKDKLKK